MPKACALIPNAAIQHPETNPQWRQPKDVYVEFAGPRTPSLAPVESSPSPLVVDEALIRRDKMINEDAQRYQSAEGRESNETAPGLTIVGAEVREVVTSSGHAEKFYENGAWQIRISGDTLKHPIFFDHLR